MLAQATAGVDVEHAGSQSMKAFHEALQNAQDRLAAADPLLLALVMVILGAGFLVFGYPLYRFLVVVIFAVAGFFVGIAAAAALGIDSLFGMIAGPLVLGLLAWPLVRAAWATVGGGAFAMVFVGYAMASGVAAQSYLYLIGGVSFATGCVMTYMLVRPLIIIVTSVSGAVLLVNATVTILTRIDPSMEASVALPMKEHPWILVLAVAPVAAAGMLIQFRLKTAFGDGGGKGGKKGGKRGGEE
jgi:hypothetical protein